MTTNPPPGWYPNAQGQQQWWDGQTWGPIAPAPQTPVGSQSPTEVQPQKRRVATWAVLLIIGIVAAVVFLLCFQSDNQFDEFLTTIAGVTALIGLVGGLISFLTTRKG